MIWTEGNRCFPVVIAGKINVLPAEWRQTGQIILCWMLPLIAKVIDSALQVGGIPQNDGRDEQVQTTGAVALVLIGAVADFAQPVEEYGAAECILGSGEQRNIMRSSAFTFLIATSP